MTTFDEAATEYLREQSPGDGQRRYIERLREYFAGHDLVHITHRKVNLAAWHLYPDARPATRNRQARSPVKAVLNYWADWHGTSAPRIKMEPETPSPVAVASLYVEENLLNAMPGSSLKMEKSALIIALFRQGWRITEALGLQWSNVDLLAGTVQLYVGKVNQWVTMPLHPKFQEALRQMYCQGCGVNRSVFPWTNRNQVYDWLKPLRIKANTPSFTPHMARRNFATRANDAGFSTLDIKAAGSWTSTKSIERYVHVDMNRAKKVMRVI